MDVLSTIRDKTQLFSGTEYYDGLKAVILHLEIAERHLSRGKDLGEDWLFTDVVYRTNHAFEGVLKEAYSLFEGKVSQKATPYQIEQYLEASGLLKERVLTLFTNYRIEWRNESTHDYQLLLSEQEAFLAIVNVSAFISIMLDQMVERMAFSKSATSTANLAPSIRSTLPGYDKLSPLAQVQALIVAFANEFEMNIEEPSTSIDSRLAGELSGYISAVDPGLTVVSDPTIIVGQYRFVVDLILNNHGEKIIVEIKRPGSGPTMIRSGEEQLFSYLGASGITAGILFVPPAGRGTPMATEAISRSSSGVPKQVVKIYPTNTLQEGRANQEGDHQ